MRKGRKSRELQGIKDEVTALLWRYAQIDGPTLIFVASVDVNGTIISTASGNVTELPDDEVMEEIDDVARRLLKQLPGRRHHSNTGSAATVPLEPGEPRL